MKKLEYLIHEPSSSANACCILLHGLGANGHDMEAITRHLSMPDDIKMRFIMPHAPIRAVTINHGMPTNSWFDIKSIDYNDLSINFDEFNDSIHSILSLISQQIKNGISSNRIFLIGFSQGGVIALHASILSEKKLAGVGGLSTYIPLFPQAQQFASEVNKTIPIFLAHGHQDAIIPIDLAMVAKDMLQDAGYDVTWNEYRGAAHEVTDSELMDLQEWMIESLNNN